MNFNLYSETYDAEYDLFRTTTEEIIQLYGVPIKYIITTKINQDHIFGEHSHIEISNDSVYEFFVMPGSTDMWEGEGNIFSKFGLQNMDTLNIFISRTDMEKIHPEIINKTGSLNIDNSPIGNLISFNSNKLMEVTNFELSSPDFGNNNVFTSNRDKNVYKLTLKSYIPNRDDYTQADDIQEYGDFGNLESIFNDEENNKEEQDHRAKDVLLEDEIIYPNELRSTAIREKEDSVFGDLG